MRRDDKPAGVKPTPDTPDTPDNLAPRSAKRRGSADKGQGGPRTNPGQTPDTSSADFRQGSAPPFPVPPRAQFSRFGWDKAARLAPDWMPANAHQLEDLRDGYNAALDLIANARDVAQGAGTVLAILSQESMDDFNRDEANPDDRPLFGGYDRGNLSRLAECAAELLVEKVDRFLLDSAVAADGYGKRRPEAPATPH